MMNGIGQAVDEVRRRGNVHGVEVQIHMPAERLHALDRAMELAHVRHAAEVLHEVEAHAAETLLVQASRNLCR